MMMIGLCGRAGAGKDTVADVLIDRFGFSSYSLAAEIKSCLVDLDPFIPINNRPVRLSELLLDSSLEVLKRSYPEVRRLLQVLGAEVVRARVESFWVDRLEDRLVVDKPKRVVITDVRFENEIKWIRYLGGMVFCVERDGVHDEHAGAKHSSELGVDDEFIDSVVNNSGSLEDLICVVEDLMRCYGLDSSSAAEKERL